MFKDYLRILILLSLVTIKNVSAYPHFIGVGYKSCITCHYNPFGNGPVNDYGRAVGGTLISSRGFYDDNKPEDLIAKETGFFFKENLNKHFRPSIGYRGMFMKTNLGQATTTSEYINMQLDASLVLKFGEKDQYIASGTYGYTPIPRSLVGTQAGDAFKQYNSKEHYLGYRPTQELGIYLGLMDKPFGIRIAEHNSFARAKPLVTMNDQVHGVLIHYGGAKVEGGIDFYVGNLTKEKDLQTKGVSGTFEVNVLEKSRIGGSLMKQKDSYLEFMATSFHSRSEITHGTSLLFEIGRVDKTTIASGVKRKEYYTLLQNHITTMRGVTLLNSVEYFKNSLESAYQVRFGPGLQYFPVAKVETRIDLYNTRTFNQETSTKDRWDLLAQLHLWF